METVKKIIRENKKIVALILAAVLGFAGIKLAPETTNDIVDAVIEAIDPQEPKATTGSTTPDVVITPSSPE